MFPPDDTTSDTAASTPNATAGRGRRPAVLVLIAALALQAGAGVAAAQSFQGAAGTVVVPEGATYERVEGVAGTVVVRGTVAADVAAAAGTVHVARTGRVEGSIEAAAGTVRVDGSVVGDVSVAGGTVEVGDAARIGGDLEAGAGYVSLDGRIDGDVRVGAETLVLGPNAAVGGSVRYDAENFSRDPGATVAGGIARDRSLGGDVGPVGVRPPAWLGTLFGLLANLALGAALLAVFPAFSARVADRVADAPVTSGGVGLLALVGVPVALVAVAITIVGIPLALVGGLAFAVAVWVALVYGQYAVGAWALGLAGRENRWLALLLGLLGFAVLGLVPVLGGLLDLLALLLGLGALAIGLRDAYRQRRGAAGGRQTTLDEVADDRSATQG